MPSGTKIDWSLYDDLIERLLPTMMISDFVKTYLPLISTKAVGARAKKLGIKPARKTISDAHKAAAAAANKETLTKHQISYIRKNANKIPRYDMAKHLGISLYLVNVAFNDLGIEIDREFTRKIQAERSKLHVHLATEASNKRWEDPEFRSSMSAIASARSKQLWQDERYRCKVKKGIANTYDHTDLKQRLSTIGKQRYRENKYVRETLHQHRSFKNSKLNDRVALVLDAHNISYQREFEIANYKVDFKIGDTLLEVQGDYWHNLPRGKHNDAAKATIIRRYYPQYHLRYLWESEFYSIRGINRLLEVIEFKPPESTPIDLSELRFEQYTQLDSAKKFVDSHHYLGWAKRASLIFRMQYEDQTVILASFGGPIRLNTAPGKVLELIRLCRYPYFVNKNMASYFLSKCTKEIRKLGQYDNLVSFADDRLHTGAVYKAANWRLIGKTQSDYQYLSNANIPMHKKTLYNRAKRAGMTEREYAESHGYRKTSAGTKTKFVLDLN